MTIIRLGNAPVSYGIYGQQAAQHLDGQHPADQLLRSMAAAGYEGSELGPPGLFGNPQETRERFAQHDLRAVGVYLPVHFTDPALVEHDFASIEQSLQELAGFEDATTLGILADEGTPQLLEHPARERGDPHQLDDAGWDALIEGVRRGIDLVRSYGVRPSFHPHISTFVESPWEIERLLAATDVDLTLDTGHVFLAGGDPTACLDAWFDRVNHIHVKDVHLAVLQRAKAQRRKDFDAWWADVSCALGQGDVALESFVTHLVGGGYQGWIVIEQDRAPARQEQYAAIADEQQTNRRQLERWLQNAHDVFHPTEPQEYER